jgi:hypothetical protein
MRFFLLMLISINAYAVDLREYFPATGSYVFKQANGADNAKYTYQLAPAGFLSLYNTFHNLTKPGNHYLWRKEYWNGSAWNKAVDQIMFMGDDLSVTETGGWRPSGNGNIVVGYQDLLGNKAGLIFAPVGGITGDAAIAELKVFQQSSPGSAYQYLGQDAYSKSGLIEYMPTYTPPYGRDANGNWCAGCSKTYTDVVHIVIYHGTKTSTSVPIRCNAPIAATGAYYQSFKNYSSYAIELWLAKGKGVIQESTPFIEDAAYWGGAFPNCSGGEFSSPYTWDKFIDEQ